MLKLFLEKLSDETKSSFVEIEKETNYLFNLTEDIQIEIKKIGKEIYFLSKIIPNPKENREEIFTYLMKINLLGKTIGNNSIGLDNNEKFLTLSYVMFYEENYKTFKEKIEDFINYLLYLEEEIEKKEKIAAEKIY